MATEVPEDFYEKLTRRFGEAVESKSIEFSGSLADSVVHQETIGQSNVDFQLTLLKSLIHRPEQGTTETNPFAKPEPELTILSDFGHDNEFRVVFNKYPVVPNHFMLITKAFVSQNTPLSVQELSATFALLRSLKSTKENWFAFYNCGPQSGASQPHKHVQFMTLPQDFTPYPETIARKSDAFIPNVKLEPLQNADLPFAHFIGKFPDNVSDLEEEDLVMYFASLLQRTLTVLRDNDAAHTSYNFIMTTKYMMLVPRSLGKYKELGINSCGMLGLLLCKNADLLELVQQEGPVTILKECGFSNTAGKGTDEYHY